MPHENSHQIVMIDDYDRMRRLQRHGRPADRDRRDLRRLQPRRRIPHRSVGAQGARRQAFAAVHGVYIPLRAIPANLDKDNRYELVISRNISVSAQIFSNYRDYPQGEMHSVYWDGVGMSLQWKTARIKGTIVDYALADMDNDGALDLVVNIKSHTGMAGTARKKSMVVAYPLDLSQAGN